MALFKELFSDVLNTEELSEAFSGAHSHESAGTLSGGVRCGSQKSSSVNFVFAGV